MEKFRVYGATTKEETQREREHRILARKTAAEGIVLLQNNGVLPLKTNTVALYGAGARDTVKGGSGSGSVNERYSVNIETGLYNAGIKIPNTNWMDRFEKKCKQVVGDWKAAMDEKASKYSPIRTMDMFNMIHEYQQPYPDSIPIDETDLTNETDTAIYVITRQAGEGGDRKKEKGDYMLSDVEEESIRFLRKHFTHVILVINCGSSVDLSILDEVSIDAVLFFGQGGEEGGNALADILTGKATPSAKLTDTWAYKYEDYPSADTYSHVNGETSYENYYEGIYVGYRYFTSFGVKPRFPFGHGLSYTSFTYNVNQIEIAKTNITVTAEVRNTGDTFAGKEVLQLYLQKPSQKYDGEAFSLVDFAKTKELACAEAQEIKLSFDLSKQGVFDEKQNAFVLEAGEYGLFIGNSVENLILCGVLTLDKDVITEYTHKICPKEQAFPDWKSTHEAFSYDKSVIRYPVASEDVTTVYYKKQAFVVSDKVKKHLATLSDKEKIGLVTGGGYSIKCFVNVMGAAGRTDTSLMKKGIPNIVLSDGPAGLNVNQAIVVMPDGTPRYPEGLPEDWQWGWLKKWGNLVKAKPGKGRPVYNYMTAWPNETLMAQTWNLDLIQEVGQAIGKEMREIGVAVWLAPGMNIHRNPLCGRNFEYYSEDPYVSGKMAAAVTKGVQGCGGVGVTIKHFCCNNQEENRTGVTENLSQRALREIYLRGFRIAIEESQPWTIMSSYNKVNDAYVVNSHDLCTKVLRDEWGFEGLVMSDWNATDQCSHAEAINVGNDLIMPGNAGVKKALKVALENGSLDREALNTSAARVLRLVFDSFTSEGF